jgi:hypothetical protein
MLCVYSNNQIYTDSSTGQKYSLKIDDNSLLGGT